MEPKFTIRQMLPEDILKLRQIIDVSFSRFMGFFAKYSLQEEGQVLVMETERAVVGYTKLIEFNVGEDKFGCILWIEFAWTRKTTTLDIILKPLS